MKTATAERPKDDNWVNNVPKDEAKFAMRNTSYDLVVGPPKETAFHTRKQLEDWGIVGLYKKGGSYGAV